MRISALALPGKVRTLGTVLAIVIGTLIMSTAGPAQAAAGRTFTVCATSGMSAKVYVGPDVLYAAPNQCSSVGYTGVSGGVWYKASLFYAYTTYNTGGNNYSENRWLADKWFNTESGLGITLTGTQDSPSWYSW